MSNFFLPHVLLDLMTCLVAFLLVFIIWPRRRIPGGWFLLAFALSVVEWSFAATAEAVVTGEKMKILWSQIEYLGFTLVAPCILLFIKSYLSKEKIKFLQVIPWFILPVITDVLVWTNPSHQLIWTGFTAGNQALNILIYGHGPWFYIHAAYIYVLVGICIYYLVRALIGQKKVFHWQIAIILLSMLFPIASGTTYMLGWEPVQGMDISIMGFVFTGMIITLAILRFQLLDLVPVARTTLVERMRDGVIVIDEKKRIVDINPAVQKLFNSKGKSLIGKDIREIFPEDLAGHLQDGSLDESTYEMQVGDSGIYIEVYTAPLKNKQKETTGTLLILREITRRKKAEFELQDTNMQLQERLTRIAVLQESLQAQVVRDPLTNLYNRRYLEETLNREIGRAQRSGLPLSVIMMDIDHFKEINDHYGHMTGDAALKSLAEMILSTSRREDIACRYGGEEFVLILPGSTIDNAAKRAEEWRQKFSEMRFDSPKGQAGTTISAGVAVYPGHGETDKDLIQSADQAMYAAKQNGRNQVVKLPLPSLE